MRRGGGRKRRDATEPAIIAAYRACGFFVQQCHGDGAPDLIVHGRGQWLPVEVKSEKGTATIGQQRYPIARTVADALALFGITA